MKPKILTLFLLFSVLLSPCLNAQDASFYIKYANKGDKDAMCKLANCYLRGEGGVEQNLNAALNWYETAAKKGSVEGQFMAAYCYFYGLGTSEDFMIHGLGYLNKAQKKDYIPAHWLAAQYWKTQKQTGLYLSNIKKAAEGGFGEGQSEYGLLYLYGSSEYGITQDIPTGVSWLKKAAENGSAKGTYYLGVCYDQGAGVVKDHSKALEYYDTAAQLGNAEAQAQVGYAFLIGDSVDVDYSSAYQYFKAAAEQDNGFAYGKIGDMYYYGLGVDENNNTAMDMYKAAANLGDAYSMCQLAYMYGHGIGASEDHNLMYKYYKQAADLDNAAGQCGLGDCYMYGYGVSKSENTGYLWYKKAAEQENAAALYRLAYCFRDGRGTGKNTTKFIESLEKSANLDYTAAKSALGYEYYNGEYTPGGSNFTKAVKWFKEAANDDDVYSESILGYCYYTGTELFSQKDYDQAFIYLSKAVRNARFEYQEDDMKASIYRSLAGCYRYGRGCEADQSLASYYTEQAAKYGDEGSQRATGLLRKDLDEPTQTRQAPSSSSSSSRNSTSESRASDYSSAPQSGSKSTQTQYYVLKKPAQNNNWKNNATSVAIDLYNKGVDEREKGNYANAADYFLRSFKAGCDIAGNDLALAYAYGRGVSKNLDLARYYIDTTLENFRTKNLIYPMGSGFWYVDVLDSKGEICVCDNDWDEAMKIFETIVEIGDDDLGETTFIKAMMDKLSIGPANSKSTTPSGPITVKAPSNKIETASHRWEVVSVEVMDNYTYVKKRVTPKTNGTWVCSSTDEFIEDAQTGKKYYLTGSTIGTSKKDQRILSTTSPHDFTETYPGLPASVKYINISSGSQYYVKNLKIR